MTLVTDSEVKELIDTDRDTTPFIEVAHLIITEDLDDSEHSDDRLRLIELYLAAHFVALSEEKGGLTRSRQGDASEEYSLVKDRGIAQTRYGQTAIDLDTTGTLKNLARKGLDAKFTVV